MEDNKNTQKVVVNTVPEENSVDWENPKTYEGIEWSEDVAKTVKNGVPAGGHGQLSLAKVRCLWALGFVCFNGMGRCYIGDTCMGVLCCIFGGFGWIGTIYDFCYLGSQVNKINEEIRSKVFRRNPPQGKEEVVSYRGQPTEKEDE